MNKKIIDFSRVLDSFSTIKVQNRKYLEAVTEVQNRMITMYNLEMPPKEDFYNVPESYDEIAECYKEIKDICTKFTITLYTQLKYYPNQCLSSLGRIDTNLVASLNKICEIQDNPDLSDKDLRTKVELLESYMSEIIIESKNEIASLEILLNNLNIFSQNEITRLNKLMEEVLDKIGSESADYEKARKELVVYKLVLEEIVESNLQGLYISVGSAVAALVIGTFILGGALLVPGNIALVFTTIVGVITIAGPLIYTAVNGIIAIREQDKLYDAIEKLTRYEADILIFSDWCDTVFQCKEQMADVEKDLESIREAWSDVEYGFMDIKCRIEDSKGRLDAEEWSNIKTNLEKCQKISEETKEMLETMKIEDTRFSKADLKADMTEKEIQTAVEQAEMLTFEEYMLAI